MKKKIITGLSILALALSTTVFIGCGSDSYYNTKATNKKITGGYFTCIKEWGEFGKYKIVYANDTRVMYLICVDIHRFGITPLYNTDGTLQIYGEGE